MTHTPNDKDKRETFMSFKSLADNLYDPYTNEPHVDNIDKLIQAAMVMHNCLEIILEKCKQGYSEDNMSFIEAEVCCDLARANVICGAEHE